MHYSYTSKKWHNQSTRAPADLQLRLELRLRVVQNHRWRRGLLLRLLFDVAPDVCVDVQGVGQGHVGRGARDPAAQRAGGGQHGELPPGQPLQAQDAEGVVAVEDSWDSVAAAELVEAHHTLELVEHGGTSV